MLRVKEPEALKPRQIASLPPAPAASWCARRQHTGHCPTWRASRTPSSASREAGTRAFFEGQGTHHCVFGGRGGSVSGVSSHFPVIAPSLSHCVACDSLELWTMDGGGGLLVFLGPTSQNSGSFQVGKKGPAGGSSPSLLDACVEDTFPSEV